MAPAPMPTPPWQLTLSQAEARALLDELRLAAAYLSQTPDGVTPGTWAPHDRQHHGQLVTEVTRALSAALGSG